MQNVLYCFSKYNSQARVAISFCLEDNFPTSKSIDRIPGLIGYFPDASELEDNNPHFIINMSKTKLSLADIQNDLINHNNCKSKTSQSNPQYNFKYSKKLEVHINSFVENTKTLYCIDVSQFINSNLHNKQIGDTIEFKFVKTTLNGLLYHINYRFRNQSLNIKINAAKFNIYEVDSISHILENHNIMKIKDIFKLAYKNDKIELAEYSTIYDYNKLKDNKRMYYYNC